MARKVDKEAAERRRDQILKAAGECFSEKGFHQSSMADICARAGLSPGTVYHYFASKDDMILHFAERELEESRAYAASLGSASTVEELIALSVDGILESDEYGAVQLFLEVMCEGGRSRKVGAVLRKADEVVFSALKKHLKRLGAVGKGTSPSMLSWYVGVQLYALELFKADGPSGKECAEMSRLFRRGLGRMLRDE